MGNATTTTGRKRAETEPERWTGQRTVLRQVTAADLPILQVWDADPAIIALMGRKFQDMNVEDWFQSVNRKQSCRAWVIENLEGRLIGELELAHINRRDGSAELRICIGEQDCWSQGYGTDAIRTAMGRAFETLGLRSVYLRVFATNTRAVHVYERMGFRKQAVLEPCSRRQDPAPVLLMNLTQQQWNTHGRTCAS